MRAKKAPPERRGRVPAGGPKSVPNRCFVGIRFSLSVQSLLAGSSHPLPSHSMARKLNAAPSLMPLGHREVIVLVRV